MYVAPETKIVKVLANIAVTSGDPDRTPDEEL